MTAPTETEQRTGTRRMRAVNDDLQFALSQPTIEEQTRLLGSGVRALQVILKTWENELYARFPQIEGSDAHVAELAGVSRPLVGKVRRKLAGLRRVPKEQE